VKNRVAVLLLPLLALALPVISATARAEDISPPASEWRSYCTIYLAAVDGSGEASDLEVTYCIGVTKGLLNGMRVGSQIGALAFGSRLAVAYKLDPDEVFKKFQQQDSAGLLGICSPADATAPDFVRAVLSYLDRNPAALQRPIGEVFFEGLEAAYPCR
jgi:hypothetical protein